MRFSEHLAGNDGTLTLCERFPDMPAVVHVYDFPLWKWPVVRQCFSGRHVEFVGRRDPIPATAWLVLWGRTEPPVALNPGVRIIRMEDGFLRSVGLGAELVRPVSWVIDGQGIYYDASWPSDLEAMLAGCEFDAPVRSRAAALRQRIVSSGLTKYNVGFRTWARPAGLGRVILVPGQVESDASIAYGAPSEKSNMGLLQAVRNANPDAYIVYKPHPDVIAHLRREGRDDHDARRWCDEVVTDVSMARLLIAVDEVHVMTSLAGFEAMLRGKAVTCYGQPFYSGWGLTRDLFPNTRRTRRLSLDELVAGVLIAYPLYLSRDGRRLITPEEALDILFSWRQQKRGREAWWRGIYRVFLRIFIGVK